MFDAWFDLLIVNILFCCNTNEHEQYIGGRAVVLNLFKHAETQSISPNVYNSRGVIFQLENEVFDAKESTGKTTLLCFQKDDL